MGGEVDLVDHQQVAAGDARPALARDLVAGGDVDHVDREIRQLRAEGGGQVVAAALDQDQVERGEAARQVGDAGEVDRGVLADRGVRAAAGLDAQDALGRQGAGAGEELRVLLGVDVVGDGGDVVAGRGTSCTARPSARSCRSRRGRRCRCGAGRWTGSCAEQPGVLGFVAHGGEVGTEGAAADVVQGGARRGFGHVADRRFQRGEHAQPGGLAERHEAHRRRDQVGREGLQMGRGGGVLVDPVAPASAPSATG